ncbi:MAG: hypothetical protein IRZ17_20285 [Mycolicibacterium hassiacum]|nr:hypothetical protein [Mycolicibacterium hassiacum]
MSIGLPYRCFGTRTGLLIAVLERFYEPAVRCGSVIRSGRRRCGPSIRSPRPTPATIGIPASHRRDDRHLAVEDMSVRVEMPPGSCVFFVGTLWHGGDADCAARPRLAVTATVLRTVVAHAGGVHALDQPEIARVVSEDIRRGLGYSIHPPFIGRVSGMRPERLLETV